VFTQLILHYHLYIATPWWWSHHWVW